MKIIDSLCHAGLIDKTNEDTIGHSSNAAWVIDGATGLCKQPFIPNNEGTDASWFTKKINKCFLKYISQYNNDFSTLVEKALLDTIDAFNNEASRKPSYQKEQPLAAFVIACYEQGVLKIGGLGDCVVLVEASNKIHGIYGDEIHAELDKETGNLCKKLTSQGMSAGEVRAEALLLVEKQRETYVNYEGGFWQLGLTTEPSKYVKIKEFNLGNDNVGNVLLMSDGFYALVEDYNKYDDDSLMKAAKEHGLQELYNELRNIENDDSSFIKYPRLKVSDDASAILVSVT